MADNFFTRILHAIMGSKPEPVVDSLIGSEPIHGFSQAEYLQIALRNIGLYDGAIDGEFMSPGGRSGNTQIEPDMQNALEAYATLRRSEGVELGDGALNQAIVHDLFENTPLDIRTPRNTLPAPAVSGQSFALLP